MLVLAEGHKVHWFNLDTENLFGSVNFFKNLKQVVQGSWTENNKFEQGRI